jgi:hypothetical protein
MHSTTRNRESVSACFPAFSDADFLAGNYDTRFLERFKHA